MGLSKRKQERIERDRRKALIAARSLNGRGYFMDASADSDAKMYIETGDEQYLRHLPNYNRERSA